MNVEGNDDEGLALVQRMVTNVLAERAALASRLGLQFGGVRDVYRAAGYDATITSAMYTGRFERQDIASRVVNAPADETWRLTPMVRDGMTWETGRADTAFVQAWAQIANGGTLTEDGETVLGALHYLHRVDRVAGIGRYGVLLLGVRGGDEKLEMPLQKGRAQQPSDLLYLSALEEQHAEISSLVTDVRSRRYGLPEFYRLTMWQSPTTSQMRLVHWSRVLHVAERPRSDEVFGTPRLQACWNRLIDLEKILPAAGEAAWKLLDAGQIISTRDGYQLPDDPVLLGAMREQIDEFMHNLRRFLLIEGIDAQPVSGQVTDPTGLVKVNISLIAAATGIPQRILLGAEAGELASTQDQRNWANTIRARQKQFAEPVILRAFINRLIWLGVLPRPESGAFVVTWPDLVESDNEQEAKTADVAASALQRLQIGVDAKAFVRAYMPQLPAESVQAAGKEVSAANAARFRGDDYP